MPKQKFGEVIRGTQRVVDGGHIPDIFLTKGNFMFEISVDMPADPESIDHAVDKGRYETVAGACRVDDVAVRNGPRGRSNYQQVAGCALLGIARNTTCGNVHLTPSRHRKVAVFSPWWLCFPVPKTSANVGFLRYVLNCFGWIVAGYGNDPPPPSRFIPLFSSSYGHFPTKDLLLCYITEIYY